MLEMITCNTYNNLGKIVPAERNLKRFSYKGIERFSNTFVVYGLNPWGTNTREIKTTSNRSVKLFIIMLCFIRGRPFWGRGGGQEDVFGPGMFCICDTIPTFYFHITQRVQ